MRPMKKIKTGLLRSLPIFAGLIGVLTLGSCNDWLTIYPTDKTVAEDFWKTKDDVDGMLNGAYQKMIAHSCTERAIVWGAYRSDELVKNSSYVSSDLENISAVNLLPTSGYTNWSSFYSVINACNIVLNHAKGVMDLDPDYTEGDYQVTRAQMLALRSLCYFYLVRAFRDVPYTTQSYEDDDQEMSVAQSTPDSVLQHCIRDLEEAEKYVMKSGAYGTNDWRNCGYFTRDAVDALLCDIYLWRASMKHSASDYQTAIDYADKVIASKDQYYKDHYSSAMTTGDEDSYHLLNGMSAYYNIFVNGNSRESILEFQYNGTNNANTAVLNLYSQCSETNATSILMGSQIFAPVDANANGVQGLRVFMTTKDYRYWNSCFGVGDDVQDELSIRKYISTSGVTNTTGTGGTSRTTPTYANFQRNWIVYRLTDVMLMKAEAETQLASESADAEDEHIQQAFNLVQAVYKRSLASDAEADTLKPETYATKESMELLVLAERERELCFEGKRWFDLMRYAYRHMDGVNADEILADKTEWPSLPSRFLQFIVRKYTNGGDAVSYKMKTEPYLYWPIRRGELKVNKLLKQNPVYVEEETTSKN